MAKDNKLEMGEKEIKGLLFKYSLPAIIGMLSNALYNIVDTMFIGNGVGPLGIAGLSLSFPIQMIIGAFALMFGVGCASVESIKFGQKKAHEASAIVGNTIVISIIFAFIYLFTVLKCVNPILSFFGASEATLPYARDYITIVMIGAVPLSFSMVINNTLRAVGQAKKAMVTMLVGTLLNIILDPVFIFGFKMGIKGAAIATVIGQFAGAFVSLYFVKKGYLGVIFEGDSFRLRFSNIKQVLSVGVSTFIRQIGVSVVAIAVNYQLSVYGGDLLIASYGIINKFISLFLMPMFGIAQGAQPLIGYNFGAGKIERVKKTLKLSQIYCILIGVLGFLGALLIPKLILKIFTDDVELINVSILPIRIIFSTLILVAISTVGSTLFQATGNGKEAFFLNLLRQIILFLPLVFILPLFFGVNGIWFSFFVGEFITAMITLFITGKGLTKMEKESQLLMPKNS